ncbi:MAG: thioredoxin family protein [Deltaproteobacteria bacterium]|jgi:thioredoxin 1|nr:thioredoxin family protein [Deltaproteobacteria bacterium]
MEILTVENFDIFIKNDFAIVFTHKPNCPHCKILKTVINKVLPKFEEIPVACLDSLSNEGLMKKLDTDRVPTLLICSDGEIIAKKSGIMNPQEMQRFISGARSNASR